MKLSLTKNRIPYSIFIISCYLWGFLAHGMALTNKYCFHDDQYALFMVSGTYNYGRWMMGVLGKLESILFFGHYSTPLISGIYMLTCIAAAGCMILRMFEITDKGSSIALAGAMTSLPVITSLFGYMSWGGYHITSLLMAVAGVFVLEMGVMDQPPVIKNRKDAKILRIFMLLLAIALLACSTGIYQAYFPFGCALMLIYYLQQVLHRQPSLKKFLIGAVTHIGTAAAALYLYLAGTKFFVRLLHTQVVDYASLNTLGTAGSMLDYPARIPLAYRQFFAPARDTVYDMYPWTIRIFYYILLAALIILLFTVVSRKAKSAEKVSGTLLAIECIILAAVFPLAVNLIFVLSDLESVHTLMMYPVVSIPIAVIVLLKEADGASEPINEAMGSPELTNTVSPVESRTAELSKEGKSNTGRSCKPVSVIYAVPVCLLLLMNLAYCRYDNVCYLKAEFLQQQAIGYFTTLAARMQSVQGYRDGMPVLYLNPQSKSAETLVYDPEFDEIHIIPYGDRTVINSYTWPDFMRRWCGYGPVYIAEPEGFQERQDIKEMPHYPNDGSIRIIDDVLVVKF